GTRASVLLTTRTRYGFDGSSSTGDANTMDRPEGCHCGARYALALNGSPIGVSRSNSLSQTTRRPLAPSSRTKASRFPSGDQTGNALCVAPLVSARGAPTGAPSAWTNTWLVGRGS